LVLEHSEGVILDRFMKQIRKSAYIISLMGQDSPIYIFSHSDADGISATGIIVKLLMHLNRPFVLNFLPQIIPDDFEGLWLEMEPRYAIFIDLGTDKPLEIMKNSPQLAAGLIVDHHINRVAVSSDVKIYVANPRVQGIDGGVEISSSGVSYLIANMFSKIISDVKELSKLAIVGAIGDAQDIGPDRSLIGLNRIILEEAIKNGYVFKKKDFILYGRGIKPLYRLLAEIYFINIPGISGSYDGALHFLTRIGIIRDKEEVENIYLDDLTDRKKDFLKRKLIEIVMTSYPGKFTIDDVENILLGETYIFNDETRRPLKYARDTAILFNACGKMRKPYLAVKSIVDRSDRQVLDKLIGLYDRYRAIIANILRQVEEKIRYIDNIAILELGKNINEELTSTIASVLSSLLSDKCEVVMVAAYSVNDIIKVSIRKTSRARIKDIHEILQRCIKKIENISGGGHESAAGAYVHENQFDRFIQEFADELKG